MIICFIVGKVRNMHTLINNSHALQITSKLRYYYNFNSYFQGLSASYALSDRAFMITQLIKLVLLQGGALGADLALLTTNVMHGKISLCH